MIQTPGSDKWEWCKQLAKFQPPRLDYQMEEIDGMITVSIYLLTLANCQMHRLTHYLSQNIWTNGISIFTLLEANGSIECFRHSGNDWNPGSLNWSLWSYLLANIKASPVSSGRSFLLFSSSCSPSNQYPCYCLYKLLQCLLRTYASKRANPHPLWTWFICRGIWYLVTSITEIPICS